MRTWHIFHMSCNHVFAIHLYFVINITNMFEFKKRDFFKDPNVFILSMTLWFLEDHAVLSVGVVFVGWALVPAPLERPPGLHRSTVLLAQFTIVFVCSHFVRVFGQLKQAPVDQIHRVEWLK